MKLPGPVLQQDAELISTLAEQLKKAHARGEKVSAQEVCKERPELAETVSKLVKMDVEESVVTLQPVEDGATDADLGVAKAMPERIGKYRLIRQLGSGGMGEVFLAQDTELSRPVAIKLTKFSAEEPSLRERFRREARAIASLRHTGLCQVYDVGQTSDGREYMALAYIEGGTLADFLKHHGAQPVRKAVGIVRRIAQAMAVAHGQGIIHRDLKPSNVLLDRKQGEPIVTDFGLAKTVSVGFEEPSESPITVSGTIMGTPAYMPPEQLDGETKKLGPSCDIYALGVILYELLSARRPFDGPLGTLMSKVMVEAPPALPESVPFKLSEICMKALSKKPEDRFASMTELSQALLPFMATQLSDGSLPKATVISLESSPAEVEVDVVPEKPRWKQAGAKVAWLLAPVAACLLGIFLWDFWSSRDGSAEIRLSNPAARVTVTVDGHLLPRETDGTFVVKDKKPGKYTLVIHSDNFEPVLDAVTIEKGKRMPVTIMLTPRKNVAKQEDAPPAAPATPAATKPEPTKAKEIADAASGKTDASTKPPEPKEPEIKDLLRNAVLQWNDGKRPEAVKTCEQVLKREPNNPEALCLRGLYHFEDKEWNGAKDDFSKVIQTMEKDKRAELEMLGEQGTLEAIYGKRSKCLLERGKYPEAIQDATKAMKTTPRSLELLVRAEAQARLYRYGDSIRDMDTLIKSDPRNALYYYVRASINAVRGDGQTALTDKETATRIDAKYKDKELINYPLARGDRIVGDETAKELAERPFKIQHFSGADIAFVTASEDVDSIVYGGVQGTVLIREDKNPDKDKIIPSKTKLKLKSIAYSPHRRYVAMAGHTDVGELEVQVWDMWESKLNRQYNLKDGHSPKLCFSRDNKYLLTGYATSQSYSEVHIQNCANDEKSHEIVPVLSPILSLASHPESHEVFTAAESVGPALGKNRKFFGHQPSQYSVRLSVSIPEFQLLSAGRDGTVLQWNLKDADPVRRFQLGHGIQAAVFSKDGRNAAIKSPLPSSQGCCIRIIDLEHQKVLGKKVFEDKQINDLAWTSSQNVIIVGNNGYAALLNIP